MSEFSYTETKRLADALGAGRAVQTLLGCGWGHIVSTPDDTQPCDDGAVQIVVLHDGPRTIEVKLCARHRERIKQETTPHAD